MTPPTRLRPVEPTDLEAFFRHQQDPASRWAAAFVPADRPDDRAAFEARWRRLLADSSACMRTVVARQGREELVAGHVAAFGPAHEREVTYWIGAEHEGRGIASAALAELVRLEPVRPLLARVAADHAASLRVLERNGFVRVGRERSFARARGAEIDELVLRLD